MKEFSSFGQLAVRFAELQLAEFTALHHGLKKAAELVEKTAQDEIGNYQPAVGPFPAWAPLAESTKEDRVRLGYTPDDPLLRSGELRDSISHQVLGLEAAIGSTSDIMVYQEFGTATIPPRPVLGPAAVHNLEKIHKIIGVAAVSGILGGERISGALGYDFET